MDTPRPEHTFPEGLLESDEKFRALVEHAVVGIYIIQNGYFTYVNARFADIFGYSRNELIGRSHLELTHPEDRTLAAHNVKKRLSGEKDGIEYTFRGITKNDKIRYIHVYGSVFLYEGERAIIGTLIDETEMVETRKELEKLANYDSMTGLFNRRVFQLEFEHSIALGKQREHRVALIFFDLDNFKRINDSLGHRIGDDILYLVGQKIKDTLHTADLFARIGGDEFAIVVEDFSSVDEISQLVRKIQKKMGENLTVHDMTLRLGLSFGIALFPEHGTDTETLQKAADIALYEAKKMGKNRYAFFAKSSNELLTKLRLETELSEALHTETLQMYLQPQFDTHSDTLCGAEALVRWEHPEYGLLYPDTFLPLAEESGQLYQIDLFMLKQALTALHDWHLSGKKPVQLSVNVSNALFHHHEFLPHIRELKETYGECFCHIELELTEDLLLENESYANHILYALKIMGFKLSIDDFGTGYSSLSYLKKLQVDKIKIDRSFISELTHDSQDHIIVDAIILMGHALGLRVLAEGVETGTQLEILKTMQCDHVQGYYFSPAVPLKDFAARWIGT